MRAYPVSSLLLWDVPDDARDDVEVYRFIDAASDLGRHNERDRAYGAETLTFVLDGQQRLTSLLIGLQGRYDAKKRYSRSVEPQKLHIDLLRDGDVPDEQGEVAYGFAFRADGSSPDRDSYWFEVGKIRRYEAGLGEIIDSTLGWLKAYRKSTQRELDTAERNLRRLREAVFDDRSICYHAETHGDPERMLEIFVRANSGGKPLSKAALLLSNLTVHWKTINARDEVKSLVDRLNEILNRGVDRGEGVLTQDFVLKSCLVLLDLPVAYRITSFNRETCERIAQEWNEIKAALTSTADAANWFGINGLNLTSANALIPVAYFLYRSPDVRLRSEGDSDARNALVIRKWLVMALLNGVFSGSSDSMLAKIRTVIKQYGENGRPFPIARIDEAVREARRIPSSDPNGIKSILDLEHGDPSCNLALTLLFKERGWGTIKHDCDHIFPRSMFKDQLRSQPEICNRIGNLTLLEAKENREKSAKPFADWIYTREPSFLDRHLIPSDASLWKPESFLSFFEERQRLLLDRLQGVLSDVAQEK